MRRRLPGSSWGITALQAKKRRPVLEGEQPNELKKLLSDALNTTDGGEV